MSSPKTLHLTNAYHATSGGVSTFYRALMEYANSHQRPMRLVVPGEESKVEPIGSHALIYHVRAKPSPVADRRYRVLWAFGETGRQVADILRSERPDLVETADKYTLPLLSGFMRKKWIRGVPRPMLVGTSHERMDDTTAAYFGHPSLWAMLSHTFMKQYYFPMFDWHIANSPYTAEELVPASKGHRLHREIRVLPMGVDVERLSPCSRSAEARAEFAKLAGAPLDSRLLLYVGRLAAEKNLPMLVEMLTRLPEEFQLILAGDGALAPWLKEQSRGAMQGRLRVIGHVHRDRVPTLYAGADAFVHPNGREPFGIAPLEAMAAGVPLVAPNSGGVLSYAAPDNAWLARPDPDSFAAAVQDVFADVNQQAERTRRARLVAESHSWPRIAERYFNLFDEIVRDRVRWD